MLYNKAQSMINSQPKISGVDRWLAKARKNFGHTNTSGPDQRELRNRPPLGRDRIV